VCCTYAGNGRFIFIWNFWNFRPYAHMHVHFFPHSSTTCQSLYLFSIICFFCVRYSYFINIFVRISKHHSIRHSICYCALLTWRGSCPVLSCLTIFRHYYNHRCKFFKAVFESVIKRKNDHGQDTKFLFYFCV
jgi:hypothetical protein